MAVMIELSLMNKLDELLLLSGNDIPFIEAQITIHQPTLKEIAYIGEDAFFYGCNLLNFSKDSLSDKDKVYLENKTNFEVLMSIINDKNPEAKQKTIPIFMVLSLLFPNYEIFYNKKELLLKGENEQYAINKNSFEQFKNIIKQIFCLDKMQSEPEYNPGGDLARQLAEKFKQSRKKIAEDKGLDKQVINILSRRVSILATGQRKNINNLMQYTIYQLYDQFERFELKANFDMYLQFKCAGAKDLKDVEDWMKDIHNESSKKNN